MNLKFCPMCKAKMHETTGGWYCPSCRAGVTLFVQKIDHEMLHELGECVVSGFQEAVNGGQKPMKVSYKGATGELLKLELSRKEDVNTFPGVKTAREYALEIADEADGHKHVFENADVSEIKFIGATVTLG